MPACNAWTLVDGDTVSCTLPAVYVRVHERMGPWFFCKVHLQAGHENARFDDLPGTPMSVDEWLVREVLES